MSDGTERGTGGGAQRADSAGSTSATGFDRLKPRTEPGAARPAARPAPRTADREGKGVLFSGADPAQAPPLLGPFGTVTVECSACSVTTALTPLGALRAAVPSLHLPLLRRGFPSWMRCPACARRTWVRLAVRR